MTDVQVTPAMLLDYSREQAIEIHDLKLQVKALRAELAKSPGAGAPSLSPAEPAQREEASVSPNAEPTPEPLPGDRPGL